MIKEYLYIEITSIFAVSVLAVLITIYGSYPYKTTVFFYILHIIYMILFLTSISKIPIEKNAFTNIYLMNIQSFHRVLYLSSNVFRIIAFIHIILFFILYIPWVLIRGFFLDEILYFLLIYIFFSFNNILYSFLYMVLLDILQKKRITLTLLVIVEAISIALGIKFLSPLLMIYLYEDLFSIASMIILTILLYIYIVFRWSRKWS